MVTNRRILRQISLVGIWLSCCLGLAAWGQASGPHASPPAAVRAEDKTSTRSEAPLNGQQATTESSSSWWDVVKEILLPGDTTGSSGTKPFEPGAVAQPKSFVWQVQRPLPGSVLARPELTRWTRFPQAVRYRLTLLDGNDAELWTREAVDTQLTLPADGWPSLSEGGFRNLKVEALGAEGQCLRTVFVALRQLSSEERVRFEARVLAEGKSACPGKRDACDTPCDAVRRTVRLGLAVKENLLEDALRVGQEPIPLCVTRLRELEERYGAKSAGE